MNGRLGRSTRALLLGVLLVFGPAQLASAESPSIPPPPSGLQSPTGAETLSVVPSLVTVDVKPGGSATVDLTVRAAVPLDVTVAPAGLGQEPNGGFTSVAEDADTSPFSARPMLAAEPEAFRLEPGATQAVQVTVSVPPDAGQGTRYGVFRITGLPAGSSENVGIGAELGVTTLVTLADTPQTRTGKFADLQVGESLPGQPLPITATLRNTGDTHYGNAPYALTATATLQDAAGNLVGDAETALSGNSILPSFSRELPLELQLVAPLTAGRYHLEVGAGLEDGTILDRAALDFEWSGGEILGATQVPAAVPPPADGPTDAVALFVAAIIGAAIALLALAVAFGPRRRRRGPGHGASA